MNKTTFDKLKNVRKFIEELEDSTELTLKTFQQTEKELASKCDHKYPDGKPAVESSFMCSYCNICGYSDL